jgi:hypothetical protein
MLVSIEIIPKKTLFPKQKRVLDSLFAEAISRTQKFDQLSVLSLPLVFSQKLTFKTKDFGVKKRFDPMTLSLIQHLFGISAFPKGFISWIQGFQYTDGGSHHQIKTHPLFRYLQSALHPHFGSTAILGGPGAEQAYLGRLAFASGSTLDRLSSVEKMRTLKEILREKGIVKTDDQLPPRSKGNQESFRRGPRGWAETPRNPHSRRAYREHPYWSHNLKYGV